MHAWRQPGRSLAHPRPPSCPSQRPSPPVERHNIEAKALASLPYLLSVETWVFRGEDASRFQGAQAHVKGLGMNCHRRRCCQRCRQPTTLLTEGHQIGVLALQLAQNPLYQRGFTHAGRARHENVASRHRSLCSGPADAWLSAEWINMIR